jgi:hypothetical protein
MNEVELLVRDLYGKYAPNNFSEDKISYVKENYENPEDFVRDFYGKYAPEEYSEDKMRYIRDNYLSTSTVSEEEVDLGKPEAVQDAAPVTAEVEAVGTELALENGSLDSQSEVESKLIKNPNVGDEGEFVKAYDPYNDFNNIMPLSFSKVNPEKLTEMYNTKSKDLEITTKELESTANTLREQSDYIKEESNRISNSQYSNEEERKAELDFFNSYLSDYNKKLNSFNESVRQHQFELNKFNDSSKFIEWAEKEEQDYVAKQEKINVQKERDSKLVRNLIKYGAGGLAVTFGEEIFGAAANMTDRFVLAGGAGYLASTTSVSSDKEIEENYQKRIKNLQEDGLSKDRAIAIADASRKVIERGNERMKESKKNLLQFANERIKSADDRAKAMSIVENYGDIRDGNIFDWVSFASGAMAEQIPTMVITRASFGTATYALTTGSMYQEVYNSVVDGYKKEGFSEEEAMDKALTDERVNKTILHAAGVLVAGLDFVGQGSVFGKGASNALKKKAVAEAIKGMTARGVLRKAGKGQVTELVTELGQEGIEMEGTSLSLGKSFGEGVKEMTVEDVKNLVAKITFGTSGGTVYKAINNQAEYKNIAKIIKKDPILKNFALEQIDAKVLNGEFSEAKGASLKTNLQKIVRHAESFDGIIPEANMDEALRVQEEIDNLEKQIETNTTGLDKMLKSKLNEEKAKLEKLTEAPAEEVTEITKEDYDKFVDTGVVDDGIINYLADKVRNNEELNDIEQAIFNDKTSEVEDILKTETAPVKEQAEISQEEAKKADIGRRRQEEIDEKVNDRFTRVEDQKRNLESNQEAPLYIGMQYNEGMKVTETPAIDERTEEGSKKGTHTIITKVITPQINTDGVMTQSGSVETGVFDSKEDADNWVKEEKQKANERRRKKENKINAKYDAELAALGETTPSGKVSEEDTKSEEPVSVETAPLEIKVPEKFNNATVSVSKGESINEVELEDSINEAYDYLSEIENNNSEDAETMRSLVEDEIEKLENYDNITETQTRKIAEEKTVRTVKKTPRKTIPKREKDFVGKKATYSDNKGAGGRGSIIIQEGPDGRDYYVIEQADDAKVILGRRDKAFSDGVVNFDENNNPVSVTFPMSEGKQVTVKDPAIAQEFELEQMKQPEYDEQIFEETYIEFVGEEKIEVPKPKETRKAAPKAKKKLTGKAKVIDEFSETPKFKKESEEKIEEDTRDEVESVVEEMNQMSNEVASFEVPSNLSTKEKSKLSSLVSRFSEKIKKLWKGGIIKDISEYNGIPFLFTISDQLSSGATVNPFTGNTIDLQGGLGFTFTEGNEKNGWANTEEGKADETVKFALEVYNSNKPLFDRLWKEGKLPYGHVPMAIVKMGQDSILSNEALFRVAADTIKTHFSEQERENSLGGLVEDIQDLAVIQENNKRKKNKKELLTDTEEKLIRDKVLSENDVIEFINDNKFTTIDQLLENLNKLTPITKRVEVSSILFTGSVGKDTTPGKPKKKSALALVEGKPKDFYKYLHIQQLNNIIKEEATKNIPSAHIIGITSVDVLNPKVEKTNHRNYPFGPKGQMIGLLESPVHVADVFPEAYSRAIAMAKEDKSGKLADPRMAVRQAVAASGAVATMKILRGAKLSDKISDFQKLVAKLRAAFPSVVVVDSAQEFNNKLKDPNINKFVKDGDTVYGFTYDGKIFINPELKNLNTPLHEFGHIWLGFLKENNPALLEKGYKLLEGTELLKRKIEEFGDTELAREEAMAESIASRGEVLIDASKISKFKEWLSGVFNYLKKKIKGFESMSADEIQNMTLEAICR